MKQRIFSLFLSLTILSSILNIQAKAAGTGEYKPSTTARTDKKVTVSITPGIDKDSGVSKTEYKIGGGAWKTYTAPFSVTSNTTVYARTIDKVGLVSAQSSLLIHNIKKDKTKPVIIAKAGKKKLKSGAKSKKKVTVTVKDNNIKSIKVLFKKMTTSFKKSKTFKKKGVYKITALDKAGNKSIFKFTIK